MKRLITFIAFFLVAFSVVLASRMMPGVFTVRQSDGSVLQVRAFGDEHFNYYETTDGVLLVLEGKDYFVARVALTGERLADGTMACGGELISTGVLAHEALSRTAAEKAAADVQDRVFFKRMLPVHALSGRQLHDSALPNRTPASGQILSDTTFFPHSGSPKAVVILAEFSDSLFRIPDTKAAFEKYLNADSLFAGNGADADMWLNYGSVKRYFKDMSFGQFTPQFDVYGPVNLGRPLATYGAGAAAYENSSLLLTHAAAAADTLADFSEYDRNGDGFIDCLIILYAGYSSAISGNSSDCIHPKSGTISSSQTFDGKRIRRFAVCNELFGNPDYQAAQSSLAIAPVGVFCHEFCHAMGLPDLYPTPGSEADITVNNNLEYWSLMDMGEYTNNGFFPTELTAWERECFGWTIIDTLSSPADITLTTLSRGGKAYRIINDSSATQDEYFIIENIQKEGWNKYLLGHGMTVMHVDYSPSYFSIGGCKVNSTPGHPRMTLRAADGLLMSSKFLGATITADHPAIKDHPRNQLLLDRYVGQTITQKVFKADHAADPFPGTSGVTALTDSTEVAAWVYAGDFMHKPITDIVEYEMTKTVTLKFMGGAEIGPDSPENPDSPDTGITDVTHSVPLYPHGSQTVYTLQGQLIVAPAGAGTLPRGLYIIDGKKVMVR